MDISRIEAFNPNKYNWRNMTAKEIIKHKNEGENVPAQYVQWAIDFINSIYSDDNTTYEVAISEKKMPNEVTKDENNSESGVEEPQLNVAQSTRENLNQQGVSLYEQAKIFSSISKANKNKSFSMTRFVLPILENKSEKEIRHLETGLQIMKAQMNNQADRLKFIMTITGHSDIGDETQLKAAYDLAEKLKKSAIKGHEFVSGGESKLEDLGNQMLGCLQMFDLTKDFGNETVNIGQELKLSDDDVRSFFMSFSSIVIKSGENALNAASKGREVESEKEKTNDANKEKATGLHNYIEEKTGVENPKKNKNKDNKENNKVDEQNKSETNSEQGEDTNITKNQADKKETENNEVDERTTAMTFREESKNKDEESLSSMSLINGLVSSSNEEYTDLSNDIKNMINEINEIRNEILSESSAVGVNPMGSNIARINQLNEEIKQYGMEAQTLAGTSEGIISNYASQLQDIGDVFSGAIEAGGNAVSAGESLIANSGKRFKAFKYVNEIIGKNAMKTGSKAVKDGQNGLNEQNKAMSAINSNLSGINSIQSEIQSKTGVGAVDVKNNNTQEKNNTQDTNKKAEEKENKNKESEKEIKSAQNDGTDTTDKLNISLDELVKRKVRRGEYAKES